MDVLNKKFQWLAKIVKILIFYSISYAFEPNSVYFTHLQSWITAENSDICFFLVLDRYCQEFIFWL